MTAWLRCRPPPHCGLRSYTAPAVCLNAIPSASGRCPFRQPNITHK